MNNPPRAAVPFLLTVLSIASACADSGTGTAPETRSVRDSAGIEIVEVERPQWRQGEGEGEGEGWTVGAEPLLEIGALDGEEAYQLYRVTHAARLANGSIVVANGGTQELRWFGPDGRFVRSAGGQGEGPGEFESLFGLRIQGDTLWAHDFRLARMTAFDTAGTFLRAVNLDTESGLPMEVWPTDDGFFTNSLDSNFEISQELTWMRRTATYERYTADGALRDTIGTLPGMEFIISGGPAGGNTFVSTSRSPLIGHSSQQTTVGDRFVAGTTDRFEIRVYGPDGGLERLIRDSSRDLPVTDAEWNAVIDEEMADAETPEARRAVQAVAELRPAPETRPAYGRFVGDRLGFLWVAPYRPEPGQPVPWLVVDIANGAIMGTVDLPEQFRPLDIGADYVLGVFRNDLDVEYVQLFELDSRVSGTSRDQ